jgi:hypothetical protein
VIDGQLPGWVIGPGVGLYVAAMYGLVDARLRVSGAWLATLTRVEGWQPEPWRRSFLLALVAGSLGAALLGPPVSVHGYGRLSELLPPAALVPVLLARAWRWATAPAGRAAARPGTGCPAARSARRTAW